MANFLQIPIPDAARRCSLTLKESTLDNIEVRARCPFCDDASYHLYLNTELDLFYCQHCGAGGNSITLYARLRGVDNKTAYRELTQGNLWLLPARKTPPVEKQAAPLAARHDVYYDLLSLLSLSEPHRANLRERGLPDARIDENRYRSMPSSYAERRRIAALLAREHDLNGIPGFYTRDGAWTFAGQEGFLIPYCDKDGLIQGMQLRLDRCKKDGKYRWFSGRDFENGTGARSWVHVAGDTSCASAVVTEGGLKGDVASYFSDEALFVCVPGVKSISHLGETLTALGVRKVFGAYDMDLYRNPEVRKDLERMRQLVLNLGIAYEPYRWNPQFKGVDDYLFARDKLLKAV